MLLGDDVVFQGDSGTDTVQFSVGDGYLQHNFSSAYGFESNRDLDAVTPGVQARLVNQLDRLSYTDAGKNDRVTFGGVEAFLFGDATATLDVGQITVAAGVAIDSTSGPISFIADRNILLNSGSAITTVDGGITLKANEQADQTDSVIGIEAVDATLQTTGSGPIEVVGKGGNASDNFMHGVYFQGSTTLNSSMAGPTAGTISVVGVGGQNTDGLSHGVWLQGSQVSVTSVDGDIDIRGFGGNDGGGNNQGVYLQGIDTIRSTGTGPDAATITIEGTGGNTSSTNYGVRMAGASLDITSTDGDINVRGHGGDNAAQVSRSHGVLIQDIDAIRSLGATGAAADVTIWGESGSGPGPGLTQYGVEFSDSDTEVTSAAGDISITGLSGTGAGALKHGTRILAQIASTGAGDIAIHGEASPDGSGWGTSLAGAVSSNGGDITITGQAYSESQAPAGVSLSSVPSVSTTGAGAVSIDGKVGPGPSGGVGVSIANGSTRISTVDGPISITGEGGDGASSDDSNAGVLIASVDVIQTVNGEIAIHGTGGAGGTLNYGVRLKDLTTGVSSVDGAISIVGVAGDGAREENHGVVLDNFGTIQSTGTASTAGIAITGTAGGGTTENHGVLITETAPTSILSSEGDIAIAGFGGDTNGTVTFSTNRGLVLNDVTIASTGSDAAAGQITLHGEGGASSRFAHGVVMINSQLHSVVDDITVTGIGGPGGGSNHAVALQSTDITLAGTADAVIGGDGASVVGNITTSDGNVSVLGGSKSGGLFGTLQSTGGQVLVTGATAAVSSAITTTTGDVTIHGETVSVAGSIASTGAGSDAAEIQIGGAQSRSVLVTGSISSVAGAVTIENQTAPSSVSGNVTIRGATIASTGTGELAAPITIAGNGWVNRDGVSLQSGSSIVSNHGDISITGAGADRKQGVRIERIDRIQSTGVGADAASITIVGVGGGSGAGSTTGVAYFGDATSIITSVDGDISITGIAGQGTTSRQVGVHLSVGTVSSTGAGPDAGTITIHGTGGDGTSSNYGVEIDNVVTSVMGDVHIEGVGGSSSSGSSDGVELNGTLSSTGTGEHAANFTVTGTTGDTEYGQGVDIPNAAVITTVDGDVQITGNGSGGLTTGLYVNGAEFVSTGEGEHAGGISLLGIGGTGTRNNYGTEIRRFDTSFTTVDGDITIEGRGGTGGFSRGLYVLDFDTIESTGTGGEAGKISIVAKAGSNSGDAMLFSTAPSGSDRLITSVDGDISLRGEKVSAGEAIESTVATLQIVSTGTGADAANILISGKVDAGTGAGVNLSGSTSRIETIDGDISIDGEGSSGVSLRLPITSTGTGADAGNVTIAGQGRNGGGAAVYDSISTIDGGVAISGATGSGNNTSAGRGVNFLGNLVSTGSGADAGPISISGGTETPGALSVYLDGDILTAAADVSVTATGGGADDLQMLGVVGGADASGDIRIAVDSIDITSAASVQSTGDLTIAPRRPHVAVGLGGAPGQLNVSDGELTKLVDGFRSITFGDTQLGTGDVQVDTVLVTDPLILAGGAIRDQAGLDINAQGNSVTFAAAVSPGQSPGILTLRGNAVFGEGETLELEIDGLAPGDSAASHDQVAVTGTVTIQADVELLLTTTVGLTPVLDQQFVIVDNDLADPIQGAFAGLPEGAEIDNFLGSPLSARISYLGLDGVTGNDVVLTVVEGNKPPQAEAGGPYLALEGGSVALDASSTTDPDLPDDTLTYLWDLDGDGNFGETGAAAARGDETGVAPTFSAAGLDGPSAWQVALVVTDSFGESSSDTATVNIGNADPVITGGLSVEAVEHTADGVEIGRVTATDAGGDPIAFDAIGGTADGVLDIHPSTGAIFVIDSLLLDFEDAPSLTLVVEATDGDGGRAEAEVMVDLLNQPSLAGTVFVDVNLDGVYQGNEPGIDGVTIELRDASGDPVLDSQGAAITALTSDGGLYLFEDLDPGEYQVFERQPSGVVDGPESLGTLGGTIPANDTMQMTLPRTDAFDYVFAEIGGGLSSGESASIGFWQNKHGQALIAEGGAPLAQWLTSNFANVFGDSLAGASGQQVAEFYRDQVFRQKARSAGPDKADAQFMSTAMNVYFTNRGLAGDVAAAYGLTVSDTGLGVRVVNVGTSGDAFGVEDDTDLTVMQLLQATDSLTDVDDDDDGFISVYDRDGDGTVDPEEARLRTLAHRVYARINGG